MTGLNKGWIILFSRTAEALASRVLRKRLMCTKVRVSRRADVYRTTGGRTQSEGRIGDWFSGVRDVGLDVPLLLVVVDLGLVEFEGCLVKFGGCGGGLGWRVLEAGCCEDSIGIDLL